MRKLLVLIAIGVLTISLAKSQSQTVSAEHQKSMKRLAFLAGDWEGAGWVVGYDGKKHNFQQTEAIKPGLDGVILTVEGIGMEENKKVHHAFAVISADLENDNYDFQSFLFTGRGGNFEARIKNDSTLVWEISNSNTPIRYTILVSNNTWNEKGEMKRGRDWTQFFEMNLSRK